MHTDEIRIDEVIDDTHRWNDQILGAFGKKYGIKSGITSESFQSSTSFAFLGFIPK